jgi:hypothetical protein
MRPHGLSLRGRFYSNPNSQTWPVIRPNPPCGVAKIRAKGDLTSRIEPAIYPASILQ